jgi:DNA polymerase (family 10)
MTGLAASEVAKLLNEFGERLSLRGGNPFRARAYRRAAESLLALTIPLDVVITEDRLREIPGVGEALAAIIAKLHRAGTHPQLEAMRKEIPSGVLEMLQIPGLRPEKVLKLYNDLGIESAAELRQAARDDRLSSVKGLGPAFQAKLLRSMDIARPGARHLHRAAALLEMAKANLRKSHLGLRRITPAGEFRRGCELVSDLSLVAESARLDGRSETIAPSGQFSVYLTSPKQFGMTLLLATGSKKHVEALQALAAAQGLDFDEEGLKRRGKVVASRSEEQIYRALGLPFISPELREGRDEIALARENRLPELVTDKDVRGILHAHTDLSDGADTLEVMAQAVRERGYHYFGVADHSQAAHYAGGLSVDEIEEQHAAIERLNRRSGARFRIFKGIEADILADGSLDYTPEILARFDFVVASVHSRFKLDRAAQTERILQAVAHPCTTILGHMTGRQLLRRPGYEIDIEQILAACARHGVAVEINANPWRLDLDWRWHRRALDLGCMMSINPDAHSTEEIDLLHWGVEMARKGGVPKDRVLNCLSLRDFADFLENRKRNRVNVPKRVRSLRKGVRTNVATRANF